MPADAPPPPLRLAFILAPDAPLTDWVARLIERLHDDPSFTLVGTIAGQASAPAAGRPPLVLSMERMAQRALSRTVSTAAASRVLASLPVLTAGHGEPVADIALALTGHSSAGSETPGIAKEEWSVLIAGSPPHLAEHAAMKALSGGAPLVPLALMARVPGTPGEHCLFTAHYNIKPSATLMARFLRHKAVGFVLRALKCRAFGRDVDSGVARTNIPPDPAGKASPYATILARSVTRRLVTTARTRLGRPADNWELRTGTGTPDKLDLSQLTPLPRLRWLMADPFLIEHGGEVYLFYEALERSGGNAWIEVARLKGAALEPLGVALRCDYHLSFPQVFAHGGEIYMMPETHQRDRLEIWRAKQFPLEWELHATALEGMLPADSSLLHHDGGWWLFSNLSDHAYQEHSSALSLFRVDGPALKSVTPHRLNPVVIGSDVSRNAGGVFCVNGQLFRPSQNNSFGVYGYGLNLMRIDVLNAQDYRETLIRQITPGDLDGANGVHHVSFAQGQCVLDVYVDRAARRP